MIEVEIESDEDARDLPVRDFHGVVSRIEDLTPTIKGVWIKLDDGESLDFQAGQYINLQLPEEIGVRAFSLANPPSCDNEIELNIRIVPGGVGDHLDPSPTQGRRRDQPERALWPLLCA